MFKITSDLQTLCLSCGSDFEGVLVSIEDRADLESCDNCGEVGA